MSLDMTRVDVWVADVDDQPGALARLLRSVADRGADLDCVIGRRSHDPKEKSVVFLSPLSGTQAAVDAQQLGLRRLADVPTLRIEGSNEAGIGAKLTKLIAEAGVNLHGFSAMGLGHRFVCYVGFDSTKDLEKAEAALKTLSTHDWRFWRRSEPAAVEAASERR